ncbi:alkaline phosphatase-like protein [Conidiobolus coronatus NRRL 28638]|uniref:alkaline phosphatase n=1 Tax=Conidiobolus coronatus (strain ATCC 28846 / CBS 209.66 / NRRL 28638) TaxID=796925 RepID=A0A137P0J4_CONC2|nr:alkaline phosphatase-like protein [Conidiobolus coronatus NRRL 28638]|eukprot:KXN68394.1 alkaline phosphatase-like protein [Conidiobolus coronatus NRRL 28638]
MHTLSVGSIAALLLSGVSGIQFIKHPTCPGAPCVLPPAGAEFLVGARFDTRVEIHDEVKLNANGNFSVTVRKYEGEKLGNPQPFESFFEIKKSPELERWNFTYAKNAEKHYKGLDGDKSALTSVNSASKIWRNISFQKPGKYQVSLKYNNDQVHTIDWIVRAPSCKPVAKNVIFFIGDGMTTSMITAARTLSRKQVNGKYFDKLHLDSLDYFGHILTHSVDSIMTDSANSASAYNSGHKSTAGALGVYPDTSADTFDDPKVELLAELARRRSKKNGGPLGVVQDATPAAVFAHTRRRDNKKQITDMFIHGSKNFTGPVAADVYLGGGGAYFHAEPGTGKSLNKQNYYDIYAKEKGYNVVYDKHELAKAPSDKPLLGIFHQGNMNVWLDRNVFADGLKKKKDHPKGNNATAEAQPGLVDMTKKTLEILKNRSPNGFFAMIEAASVDKQMHVYDYHRSLAEIIELDNAVNYAVEWAKKNDPNTLIVVTADHGHSFDVYGTVDTEIFNKAGNDDRYEAKRNAIGAYELAGFPDYEDKNGDGFPDKWDVRTVYAAGTNNNPDLNENYQVNATARHATDVDPHSHHKYPTYVPAKGEGSNGLPKQGNLPLNESQGVHSMTQVPVFAAGPGAHLFGRVMDNTEVFFNFAAALGLGGSDEDSTCATIPADRMPKYWN